MKYLELFQNNYTSKKEHEEIVNLILEADNLYEFLQEPLRLRIILEMVITFQNIE